MFERSIDRFTSSFDQTIFSRVKGESPSQLAPSIKQGSVLSKADSDKKSSNLTRFSTVNLEEKSQLTYIRGQDDKKSNEIVNELKK